MESRKFQSQYLAKIKIFDIFLAKQRIIRFEDAYIEVEELFLSQ